MTAVASRCSGRDFDATRPLQACACGLLAGLAALAKASGAIAFPYLLYRLYAARSDRGKLLLSGLAAAGVFGLTCGPFYARNFILYGDPLATAVHTALAGNQRGQWAPFALVPEWEGFVKSLWGVFGAFNIVFPDLVYWAFFALTAVLVAAALASLRGGDPRRLGLACLVALNLLAVAAWTSRLLGSQGRLLFPCWPAFCVLSALGLARFRVRCPGSVSPGWCCWPGAPPSLLSC